MRGSFQAMVLFMCIGDDFLTLLVFFSKYMQRFAGADLQDEVFIPSTQK